MSIIRPNEIEQFLKHDCKKTQLILLYGTDDGVIRARSDIIINSLQDGRKEPEALMKFEAETLNAAPSLLLEEANSFSMFSTYKIIIVQNAGKLTKNVWSLLLSAESLEGKIILLGGELSKTSPIRVKFEESKEAATIACYPPSLDEIRSKIRKQINENGLKINSEAESYLLEIIGTDYSIVKTEIEKLTLFCLSQKEIDIKSIDQVLTNNTDQNEFELIDAAFLGKMLDIEKITASNQNKGTSTSTLLSLSINHSLLIKRLIQAKENNRLEAALKEEKIFFKRSDNIRKQISYWNKNKISKTIENLLNSQEQARKTPQLEENITIRALWNISNFSQRRHNASS